MFAYFLKLIPTIIIDIIVNAAVIPDNIICRVPFSVVGAPRGSCVNIKTIKPKIPIMTSIIDAALNFLSLIFESK